MSCGFPLKPGLLCSTAEQAVSVQSDEILDCLRYVDTTYADNSASERNGSQPTSLDTTPVSCLDQKVTMFRQQSTVIQ